MAKATIKVLPKGENETWRQHGRAIQRALGLLGWTADRLCREVKRDHRQVGRWITGEERPQLETLWDVKDFQQPLVMALGEIAEADVEMVVRVRIRRSA